MQQTTVSKELKCTDCGFQGPVKTNNSLTFLIFVALICLSAYFLPLIVVALAYLVWILSRPASTPCPKCKSRNTEFVAVEIAPQESTENNEIEE